MDDYTELVKALRDDNACLSVKTLHEAADAIEELAAEREEAVGKVVRTFTYKGITLKEWADRYLNPQTNADRVRSMSIDKLIEWFCRGRPCGSCPYGGVECGIRDWLESPVKGEQKV